MKTTKLKGAIVTDDITGIIKILCVAFLLFFLLYITGISVNDIIGLTNTLLTEIISGLGSLVTTVITSIFTAIMDVIKTLFCSIPILNMVCA